MLKATDGNTAVYYTRGFELISRREGTIASYYIYDGGLSVRALTNGSGTVTDTLVTDSFGNETGRTGTTDNPYGFQGEEQDSTGLYYLRARYMDPATGTFTTMDTYGGSLSDPMSLHKYLFANSNPIMYCDPSGHFTLDQIYTVVAIELIMLDCALLAMLGTMITYTATGKSYDTVEFGYDLMKSYIGGALIGLIAGLSLTGVFSLVTIPIALLIVNIVATTIILLGIGIILSEFWTVNIGFSLSIFLGEVFSYQVFGGIALSPEGEIDFSYSRWGVTMGTDGNDFPLALSPTLEVYPWANNISDIDAYGPLINVGGSIPCIDGTVGGDLLFSEDDGFVGFSIGTGIEPGSKPEFHVGVSE